MPRIVLLILLCAGSQTALLSAQGVPVVGTVTAPSAGMLTEAVAELRDLARSMAIAADGSFRFENVPVGVHRLRISGPQVATIERRITTAAGAPALRFSLEPGASCLRDVVVVASAPVGPIGQLPDVRGTSIYSGQKTEVLLLDSLTGNRMQNVTRELLARVPGANISETENVGYPSNGIGFRGLNPVQSVEVNVRQSGTNIAADLYGYPEVYYAPPMQAVDRIEIIRGSSSLQFGPQFGGVVNYVLRDGRPNTRSSWHVDQTVASYGALTTFAGVTGGTNRLTYNAYAQGRRQDGWRKNSRMTQGLGTIRLGWQATPSLAVRTEWTIFRNQQQMPGGLDNAQFNVDARSSVRSRNWLESPWNLGSVALDWRLSPSVRLTSQTSGTYASRSLVWFADAPPTEADEKDNAGQFSAREVEVEQFRNVTNETRLLNTFMMRGRPQTLAIGTRLFTGVLRRLEGGVGSNGSDFDLRTVDNKYDEDFTFRTSNAALFAEQLFRVTDRWSVTPGARVEWLRSSGKAVITDSASTLPAITRRFALLGVTSQYELTPTVNVYGNITQAYRPIEYSFLVPFGSVSRVSKVLRDPSGVTSDVGIRGTVSGVVTFDLSGFWLTYNNRIGLISGVDPTGEAYTERANVAKSLHRGVETYIDVRPGRLLSLPKSWGDFDLYNSFAYVDATYRTGPFSRNRVEYAPKFLNRLGVVWSKQHFSTTVQSTRVSDQFGDANNSRASVNPIVGLVPAYQVIDLSGKLSIARLSLNGGVNNLRDAHYFTRRADEYPGPGILPSLGRSFYLCIGANY
ncbi:MAG: TonB-dependent receptor [Gemmatimonadaceae bacterium]